MPDLLEPLYHPAYVLPNATNLDRHPCFAEAATCPGFAAGYSQFQDQLLQLVEAGESRTFYKFGDGDYFFLKREAVGSAAPGRRAIGRDYAELANHWEFVDGVMRNDYFTVEVYPENRAHFRELFPTVRFDYPAEYGYASVANRWLTRTFAGRIGLIGAGEKVDLVRRLLRHEPYREYLGLDDFNDYVAIPQRFACDDLAAVEDAVAAQLSACDPATRIFLLGIGHVKSGLLWRLKRHFPAVYLDVGSGIDALAGIVDPNRPFMGSWRNHMLVDFDYARIDFLGHTPDPGRDRILGSAP